MKKILLISLFSGLFIVQTYHAQAPESFNYQCVLRDNSGTPLSNNQVGIRFSILQGSATGTSVYSEEHTTTSNGYGLITLSIGNGATTDDLSAVNWGNGPYFVYVEADPSGGTGYVDVTTTQMLSVPYALYAKTSGGGTAGPAGADGIDGVPGADGVDGAPGADGVDGASGADGIDGAPGADGIDGAPGADGIDGAPGADGIDGAPGADGIDGAPGADGIDGASGADGIDGAPGADGIDGAQGPAGADGIDGADGNDGTFSVTGTSGQTIRHNGTDWVANSILFNNGSFVGIGTQTATGVFKVDMDLNNTNEKTIEFGTPAGFTGIAFNSSGTGNHSRFDIFNTSNTVEVSRYFSLGYNGEDGIAILKGGNVGVGTTDPVTKLEVIGDGKFSRGSINQGLTRTISIEGARNATASDFARIDFDNYDSNGPTSYTGARISSANEADGVDDGSLIFSTNNANAGIAERMRITDDGKVGVGTDSPNSTFSISGLGSANRLTFQGLDSDGWWFDRDINVTMTSRITARYGLFFDFENGGISTNNVLSIIDNGKVGVNTDNPTQELHVSGNMRLTGAFYDVNNNTGNSGQILSSTATGIDWVDASSLGLGSGDITGVTAGNGLTGGGTSGTVTLNVVGGTGIDVFANNISVDVSDFMTNGTNNELITAIGTDGMNSESNLRFDGSTLNVTGDIVATGTLNTAGIEELSDERWKKGVHNIDNALEKVKSIQGVYYNWKIDEFPEKNFTDKLQIGFIAQELEVILPEVVNTGDEGYKSVMYGHVVALLVEAIKDLESQLNLKTTLLEEKTKEIDGIKASLEEIQNLLGIKNETVSK